MLLKSIDKNETGMKKPKRERKERIPTGSLWLRLGILITLLMTGFAFANSRSGNTPADNILGAEKKEQKETTVKEILNDIAKTAEERSAQTAEEVLGTATQAIGDTTQNVSKQLSQTVIQTVVSTIMSQIDKLPKEQKDEVINAICK